MLASAVQAGLRCKGLAFFFFFFPVGLLQTQSLDFPICKMGGGASTTRNYLS